MDWKLLLGVVSVCGVLSGMAQTFFLTGEKLLSTECQYANPTWSDVDGDGAAELVVGLKRAYLTPEGALDYYKGLAMVLKNTGTAEAPRFSFASLSSADYLTANGDVVEHLQDGSVENNTGCWGMQAVFGDVDGDGRNDLVLGGLFGELTIYRGTGTAGQYEEKEFFASTNAPLRHTKRSHVGLWDVDGDGRDELIVGYMHSITDEVYAVGAVSTNPSSIAVYHYGEGGLTGGDTLKDLSGKALNVPNMVFEPFPQPAYTSRTGPTFADINGDGMADLVTGSSSGGVFYFPGEATNALGKASSWSSKAVRLLPDTLLGAISESNPPRSRVFATDVTGDGIVDLLVGYADGTVYLYRGTNTKGFNLPCRAYTNLMAGVKFPTTYGSLVGVSGVKKVTAKGLPAGLSLKKNKKGQYYVAGTPTKVQKTTATFKALNKKGKALATVKVTFAVRAPKVAFALDPHYVVQPGVATNIPVAVDAECAYTLKAANLPTGLKLVRNKDGTYRLSGTPTVPGEKRATFTALFITNTKKGVSAATTILTDNYRCAEIPIDDHYDNLIAGVPVADMTLEGAIGCTATLPKTLGLTFNPVDGKVSGTPKAPGKYLVTFTRKVRTNVAPAKPKYATYKATSFFVVYQGYGDHTGDAGQIIPALTVILPEEVDPVGTNTCLAGVQFELPLAVEGGLSNVASTVSAKGLPKGLVCKDGFICGVPQKAGVYKISVSASNKYGWTSAPCSFLLQVKALPAWAYGTYNGAVTNDVFQGTFTFTVASTGRLSGKILVGGKTYKFSDAGYAEGTDEAYRFAKTLSVAGLTLPVSFVVAPHEYVASDVAPDGVRRTLGGVYADEACWLAFDGEQNVWKRSDAKKYSLPIFAKGVVKSLKVTRGTLKFKFGTSGAVTISGKIDGKKVSASGTLLLAELAEAQCGCFWYGYNCRLFISVPKVDYFSVIEVTIGPGGDKRTAADINVDCQDRCLN